MAEAQGVNNSEVVGKEEAEADLDFVAESERSALVGENGNVENNVRVENNEIEVNENEEGTEYDQDEAARPESCQNGQHDDEPSAPENELSNESESEEEDVESTLEPEAEQCENLLETEESHNESQADIPPGENEQPESNDVEQVQCELNVVDNSKNIEHEGASCGLDQQSPVKVGIKNHKSGSSPTLSLAEEDQIGSNEEPYQSIQNAPSILDDGENNRSDKNGTESMEQEGEPCPGAVGGVEFPEEIVSISPPSSDTQSQEPDDPECDLASSGAYQTSDSDESVIRESHSEDLNFNTTVPIKDNLFKASSAPKLNSGSSNMKQTLGLMFKQGIKSAAKDTSQFRGVLGHLQQGLKTAINETATFLDGNSGYQRPTPMYNSRGTVHLPQDNRAVPAPSSVSTNPSQITENWGKSDMISTSNPNVFKTNEKTANSEIHSDGAGDANSGSDVPEDELLSQLESELDNGQTVADSHNIPLLNGLKRFDLNEVPEYNELKQKNAELQRELLYHRDQCTRLKSVNDAQDQALLRAQQEAEQYRRRLGEINSGPTDEVFMAQIRALENTIASQQIELNESKQRLDIQDQYAKEVISKLRNEMKSKVDQLQLTVDSCQREKEGMVLQYAKAESKNIEMENKMAKNEAKMKDMTKEKENVMAKFKTLKSDQSKCRELFELRSTEVLHLRRELEKVKELLVSQEGKTKWAHNKLRAEMEIHKETKAKLEETQKRARVTKDEAEQIRKDCQAMIRTYQESEEIKSNSLDKELKQKETELILHRQDKQDQAEVHSLVRRELDTLKSKHKEMIEELNTWRDKVKCLEGERIVQEHNLDGYRETLQKQKETNGENEKRLHELENIESEVIEVRIEISQIQSRSEELEQECIELRSDMEKCDTREQDHLEFTQKISDKNAHLQSENSALQNKVTGYSAEVERLRILHNSLAMKCQHLGKELSLLKQGKETSESELTKQLEEKMAEAAKLATEVGDLKNEIKMLKRKHAANTKDLMRQLQNSKRRLDNLEPKDASSMGSRTSSNGSLDTVNNTNGTSARIGNSTSHVAEPEPEPLVQVVEVDKQMLIEKIVRLQKAHARKNEKLEFLEDHIQQLFAEVQKKNRIIQSYALREEAGTIAPESTDMNKALLAKKGGIMSSLYNAQQQDGAMTLELSLDISRKLQAVLEDTLLKNITLKENLDTLGEEIARLSQENRQIQLKGSQDHL